MNMTMTAPCGDCPFRSDKLFPLERGRVTEIQRALDRGTFSCHKTLDYGAGDDGEPVETAKTQHCAGALILLEKLERPSQLMRIYERLGGYDRSKLDMAAPVYDTFDAMRLGCAVADGDCQAADIRATLSSLELPRRAQDGDCVRVSQSIQAALPGSKMIDVWGYVKYPVLGFGHRAVEVGGWIVDGSATQYDPALPRLIIERSPAYRRIMKRATGCHRIVIGNLTHKAPRKHTGRTRKATPQRA